MRKIRLREIMLWGFVLSSSKWIVRIALTFLADAFVFVLTPQRQRLLRNYMACHLDLLGTHRLQVLSEVSTTKYHQSYRSEK